jgi:S-adenosylmethionine:tRNA ribosyltransferase-isomerase
MSVKNMSRLRLEELDYELPGDLIAQVPVEPRDASRLLVYSRQTAALEDRQFVELACLLRPGDVIVRNDTRVYAARTHFVRATGGRLELLFLQPAADDTWEVLVRGRPAVGETLMHVDPRSGWEVRCEENLGDGRWRVHSLADEGVPVLLERHGETPLPPYIHTALADGERYQTVFARDLGSAAAPTAGLHFTRRLDDELRARGMIIEELTVHVGLGTFKPLTAESLAAYTLHSERFRVGAQAWRRIVAARVAGQRVIAVGTTVVRTLEHLAAGGAAEVSGDALVGEVDLFIAPGWEFRAVDAMITNFHLPRTSLLALVMAFVGVDETRRLYRHAVAERYRFYSFGDAMLLT